MPRAVPCHATPCHARCCAAMNAEFEIEGLRGAFPQRAQKLFATQGGRLKECPQLLRPVASILRVVGVLANEARRQH
eukprot:2765629-Lingulodinium_polyedra.AAC.1